MKKIAVGAPQKIRKGIKETIDNIKSGAKNKFDNFKTKIKDKDVAFSKKTADGHTLKVLKDGRVVKCSSCTSLDLEYGEVFGNNKHFKSRRDAVDAKLKNNPNDSAALKEIEALDADLKKHVESGDPPGTFRDKNDRLRDAETGNFTRDPNLPPGSLPQRVLDLPETLHVRPSLRVNTKNTVLGKAKKGMAPDGKLRFKDAKTGEFVPGNTVTELPDGTKVYGDFDFGHKDGHSWKQYQDNPKNHGKTREQIIDDQNNPDIYDIEWSSSNRSDGAKGNI